MPDPLGTLLTAVTFAWNVYNLLEQASQTEKSATRLAVEVQRLAKTLEEIEAEHPNETLLADALTVSIGSMNGE